MPKTTVDLRTLQDTLDYIASVNKLKLSDITWVRGDTEVFPDGTEEDIENWKFVGLSNASFACSFGMIAEAGSELS